MAEAMATSWAASRACLAVFAFVEGGEHGERALAMWSSLAAAERIPEGLEADLLEHTATCWIRAGHPRRALPLARRAVDMRRTARADPSDLGRALGRLGEAALFAGVHLDAAAALDEAADLLESAAPSGVRAEVLALRAELLMLQGFNTDAIAVAERALGESMALGPRQHRGACGEHPRCRTLRQPGAHGRVRGVPASSSGHRPAAGRPVRGRASSHQPRSRPGAEGRTGGCGPAVARGSRPSP